MKRLSLLYVVLASVLLAAFAAPVLAQPDEGNSIVVDPPDVVADCDYPPPEYRELCLERGFTPVEPPERTPEEEAAAEAALKAQAEEKAARVEAGTGKKTIEMVEEKAAAGKKARLPSTGGASLVGLGVGVLLVSGGLLASRIVR